MAPSLQDILDYSLAAAMPVASAGRVADYIPALASASGMAGGASIVTVSGEVLEAGDSDCRFTIQSISKVFALAYVMETAGETAVFSRVGQEPSGDPFNSIIRLETSAGKRPYNPLINAGAIVVSSLMPGSSTTDRLDGFMEFVRRLFGRNDVEMDTVVRESEKATANRNRSIAWFLRELGLLGTEVDESLLLYFSQCAILADSRDLARAGAMLAADGIDPLSGARIVSARHAQIIKSLMVTCGMYDGSGQFAVDVGIPAKSGVGGGILATVRDRMGIGTWGPSLDERGNSVIGVACLRELSKRLDLRVL